MRARNARWIVVLASVGIGCGDGMKGQKGPISSAGSPADRAGCERNFRSLGLTFGAYREGRGNLPAVAITDPKGEPLLSWRVTILPWIKAIDERSGEVRDVGFDHLYKMFRLDEAWDSPHNKALIRYMPKVYLCPAEGRSQEEGLTNYRLVVGPGTMFEGLEGMEASRLDGGGSAWDKRPTSTFLTAKDGLANTVMIVESGESTPWTKPDELDFAPGRPLPPLGSKHPGEFFVVFANGSIRGIKASTPPDRLSAFITRNGNEVVGP